jgi:hypothetical protein
MEAKKRRKKREAIDTTGYEREKKDFGGHRFCQQWAAADQALTDAHHTTGRQSRLHAAPVS